MNDSFNDCFVAQGGLFNNKTDKVANILRFSNELIDYIRRIYPRLPEINFNLIDNLALNATAALYKKDFYIGVNFGTINILEDIFLKINFDKSDYSAEYPKINLLNTDKGLEYNPDSDSSFLPFSNADYDKSLEHTQLVYRFIMYHEICHIMRGHVSYYSDMSGLYLQEVSNDNPSESINLLQTLEMDADSFAINRILNDFFSNAILIKNKETTIYQDLESCIYNLTYCIYIFFRIFGFYSLDISKIKDNSHPKPAIRMSWILYNISTILIAKNIPNIDYILSKTVVAAVNAEKDINEITFFDNQILKMNEVIISSDLAKYTAQILENWKLIKPDLEKFTFSTLPD